MVTDDDDGDPYDDEEPDDGADTCLGCGAHIFEDEHEWDCPYAGDWDDDDG